MYPTFGGVHALDAADGSERWRFESEETGFGPTAVAGGRVYALAGDGCYALAAPG
jgi:outer membrane protein assembly factor BamB